MTTATIPAVAPGAVDGIHAMMTTTAAMAELAKLSTIEVPVAQQPDPGAGKSESGDLKSETGTETQTETATETQTDADEHASVITDEAKAIINERIGEITAKTKAEVEAARAEADAAKAEATGLKERADVASAAALGALGILPDLLTGEDAATLQKYSATMQENRQWKETKRFCEKQIRAGLADDVVNGKTIAEWADAADTALDALEPVIQELAPTATQIRKMHDAVKTEVFKAGRELLRTKAAAAAAVAKAAAGKGKEPAQVTVKAATTAVTAKPGTHRDFDAEKFAKAPNQRDAAAAYLAGLVA